MFPQDDAEDAKEKKAKKDVQKMPNCTLQVLMYCDNK
jgi:hypothetical protein